MTRGDCSEHQFRIVARTSRSIGSVELEICNNCLSVVVSQRRDIDESPTRTVVEMKRSAYRYVK